MQPIFDESFEMIVEDFQVLPQEEEYFPVKLITSRGLITCRYYEVQKAEKAVIWVGGIGGDWDTPARGLYPLLAYQLTSQEISSLRVRYRYPAELEESILDVLAAIAFLQDRGVKSIALVGHSFGGAVVIQAAAQSPDVRTVVTLATQSYGTQPVRELATRCSILLLHGAKDQVLGPLCSQSVYHHALQPKKIILYPEADHGLDEVADEVTQVVKGWIVEQLNRSRERVL